MSMKVSNWDLRPSRTLGFRRLEQSETTARLALEHPKTVEAVAITPDSIKFNPQPIELDTWQEVLELAPQYQQPPKKVSPFHYLIGDNPHMVQTVGGGMFPVPDRPNQPITVMESLSLYDAAEQAAIQSRAKAETEKPGRWAGSTIAEVIFAGIAAVCAGVVAVALVPRLLERF